ncbi:MAG: hypothetical protein RIF33_17860 [Cyclobacteriaceae bacterium]
MACHITFKLYHSYIIFDPLIMMNPYEQNILYSIPRLPRLTLKKKRRMADLMIARHFNIPCNQLKSRLPHYEDFLLHYLRQTIYRFQLGWVTKTQYEQLLTDLFTSYKDLFLKGSVIYSLEQDRIESTRRHFSKEQDSQ